MEEKTFKLLEKMHSEFSQRFDHLENEVKEVRDEVKTNRNSIMELKNKLGNKIDVLVDGYKQNTGAINMLETKFDQLAEKVDKQEVEIRVIKGVK